MSKVFPRSFFFFFFFFLDARSFLFNQMSAWEPGKGFEPNTGKRNWWNGSSPNHLVLSLLLCPSAMWKEDWIWSKEEGVTWPNLSHRKQATVKICWNPLGRFEEQLQGICTTWSHMKGNYRTFASRGQTLELAMVNCRMDLLWNILLVIEYSEAVHTKV